LLQDLKAIRFSSTGGGQHEEAVFEDVSSIGLPGIATVLELALEERDLTGL